MKDIKNKTKKGYIVKIIKEAASGNLQAVNDLIANGVDIDVQSDSGWTALMEATSRNYIEVVHALIGAGANLNLVQNTRNLSALMIAAGRGNINIVNLLIAAGAMVNISDKNGDNALEIANISQHDNRDKILKALVDAGSEGADTIEYESERSFRMRETNLKNESEEKIDSGEKIDSVTSESVVDFLNEVSLLQEQTEYKTRDILLAYQVLELKRQSEILELTQNMNEGNSEKLDQCMSSIDSVEMMVSDIPT